MTIDDPGNFKELKALFEFRNESIRLRQERDQAYGRGGGDGGVWVKVLVGITTALVLAFIMGGVAMYRENGQLRAAVDENARRMDRLEQYVYRYLYRERP